MRYLLIFVFFISLGCLNQDNEDSSQEYTARIIKLVISTEKPEEDELNISYYNYKDDTYINSVNVVEYDDISGNPQPIIIELADGEDYDFRWIAGEIYRNNANESAIILKILSNDEELITIRKTGDGVNYVTVKFNYDLRERVNLI